MMKSEFTKLLGQDVSSEDYSKIECVYTFYPGIETKQQIVDFYKVGGMLLINDLLPRAKSISELSNKIAKMNSELNLLNGGKS